MFMSKKYQKFLGQQQWPLNLVFFFILILFILYVSEFSVEAIYYELVLFIFVKSHLIPSLGAECLAVLKTHCWPLTAPWSGCYYFDTFFVFNLNYIVM